MVRKHAWTQLPEDVVFTIMLLLPARSLVRSSVVCKGWHRVAHSSTFLEAKIHQSKAGLVFLKRVSAKKPNTHSVDVALGVADPEDSEQSSIFERQQPRQPKSYSSVYLMEEGEEQITELNICGLSNILASCNGLLLAMVKCLTSRLLVMNPITRKMVTFPLGTIVDPRKETYGFLFDHSANEYKVVHLYRDEPHCVGCEILSVTTREWHAADGPSLELMRGKQHHPVASTGALHWLSAVPNCKYIVSLGMNDEKFRTTALPITSSYNDRLVAIGGFVSYVTHVTLRKMEIWILKNGEDWTKQHSISMDFDIRNLVPLFTSRNGREIVFQSYGNPLFFVYDFEVEMMKVFQVGEDNLDGHKRLIPHINTLATWHGIGA